MIQRQYLRRIDCTKEDRISKQGPPARVWISMKLSMEESCFTSLLLKISTARLHNAMILYLEGSNKPIKKVIKIIFIREKNIQFVGHVISPNLFYPRLFPLTTKRPKNAIFTCNRCSFTIAYTLFYINPKSLREGSKFPVSLETF